MAAAHKSEKAAPHRLPRRKASGGWRQLAAIVWVKRVELADDRQLQLQAVGGGRGRSGLGES